MKTHAGMFLANAKSRLLPPSIPFRFFGAAIVFHLLAWLAMLAGAADLPRFQGGLGWPLAALHLVTLGTLVTTAVGASLQLLPVATRQPVRSTHGPVLVWWLLVPGVAAVAFGMGTARPIWLAAGALSVSAAMLVFAVLTGVNLRGARGMPGVVAHGWGALVALGLVLFSALSLASVYLGGPGLDRTSALALHLPFAAYGFMGLLALGLSYILVPMFALAPTPPERDQLRSGACAAGALLLAGVAALGVQPALLRGTAVLLALVGVALHLHLMQRALAAGMRRELGPSFVLVRVGWAALVLSLLLAAALALGAPWDGLPTLFVLTLILGWLLTFLLGMLRRILPFLASMHVGRGSRRPPTPAALSADRPLRAHFTCHLAALGALALAVITGSPALAAIAAAIGSCGALALLVFFVLLMRRMRGHAAAPASPRPTPPSATDSGT